jgi:hypothetical protein
VHSNVQMNASSAGASALPQRSQEVRSSSATSRLPDEAPASH